MSTLTQERKYIRAVGDEPLPGYRLVAPLGAGGFGEVWKCVAPGGLQKAIKFVFEDPDHSTDLNALRQEHQAFERVKGIRHPFLLTLERVELIGGELIMVMELADKSLENRYHECQSQGLPGIPRDELLSYMVDCAEALDVLSRQHGLQHLDVKPANLFLVGGHVKVGDYGLVSGFRKTVVGEGQEQLARGLTPKYVAPEILREKIDSRSDQYSLALVYQELLTGVFPYNGKTSRQLLLQHVGAEPDVSALQNPDRSAVQRALSKDPTQRFTSCLSFVKALMKEPLLGTLAFSQVDTPPVAQSGHLPEQGSKFDLPLETVLIARGSQVAHTAQIQRGQVNPALGSGSGSSKSTVMSVSEEELRRVCPGWKFANDVENGPRGRVVRATDPAGRMHRVHIIRTEGNKSPAFTALIDALSTPHPRLAQRVVCQRPHTLAFQVMEEKGTLWHITKMLEKPETPSLVLDEVFQLMEKLARTLDELHDTFGFPHALLSPEVLIFRNRSYEITLYGLSEILRHLNADLEWLNDAAYAAPEVLKGQPTLASDQYSLALIFLALRRAWKPSGKKAQRGERAHAPLLEMDASAISRHQCQVVRRALSSKPQDRFPTCLEFVEALRTVEVGNQVLDEVRLVESVQYLSGKDPTRNGIQFPPRDELIEHISQVVLQGTGTHLKAPGLSSGLIRQPDGRVVTRFPVRLTPELAKLKLEAFAVQWNYDVSTWTANTYALRPKSGYSLSGVITTKPKEGEVELVVEMPKTDQAAAGEATVTARYIGRDPSKGLEVITRVLDSFIRIVRNAEERRRATRHKCDLPVFVYPIEDDLTVLPCIASHCKDFSRTGLCLVSKELPTDHLFVTFPGVAETRDWSILSQVSWKKPLTGDLWQYGLKFIQAG